MSATAVGEGETQRRSYPGIRGQYGTRGWELVRELDLPGNAARIAEEARALLTRRRLPVARRDGPDPRQRADGAPDPRVGRPRDGARPDPRLGGGVRRDVLARPPQLGSLRFGSELMNITADATLPGALGSFGYDDEGTPAHPVDIVKDGIWVGALSGRDSAALAGIERSGGAVRADGFDRIPMVRMTNVGLLPGRDSLESMIAATDDGILDGHEPLVVDRRQAAQLPVRLRDRLGDQGRQARPAPQEPDLHGDQPALLGLDGHARRPRRVDVLGHAELRQGPAAADRPHRPSGRARPVPRDPGRGPG